MESVLSLFCLGLFFWWGVESVYRRRREIGRFYQCSDGREIGGLKQKLSGVLELLVESHFVEESEQSTPGVLAKFNSEQLKKAGIESQAGKTVFYFLQKLLIVIWCCFQLVMLVRLPFVYSFIFGVFSLAICLGLPYYISMKMAANYRESVDTGFLILIRLIVEGLNLGWEIKHSFLEVIGPAMHENPSNPFLKSMGHARELNAQGLNWREAFDIAITDKSDRQIARLVDILVLAFENKRNPLRELIGIAEDIERDNFRTRAALLSSAPVYILVLNFTGLVLTLILSLKAVLK